MTSHEKVNILMVDDQPAKLLSYEAILGELGENLIKATSGREALEQLLKNEVAVVLMDVSMPDLDGFELAEMIRQHPRFQKTAIIFISAVHLTDLDRLKGYQRGAVDYISVPVVPEVLRAKVSVFAELHRKAHQLESLNRELEQRVLDRTEELQLSERMLRERVELLELASEAIMVRDWEGRLQFWSSGAEALYGWKKEEAIGKPLHQLLKTKFPIPFPELESWLLRAGRWEGNLTQQTRDGREIVVAFRKVLRENEGTQRAILEIGRDITAQLQAEEALRRAERFAAMGRVAGIIAHEINNPLEAVTNAMYLLRDHPSLDDEARQWSRLAEQELERIAHITKQTLSFYRESQYAAPVSISDVLDSVLELQSRQLQLAGIKLEKDYRCNGVVEGSANEFRQVFLNLIGNAIQAMPSGGTLRVRQSRSSDRHLPAKGVRVSICDTGTGIRPEDAKRIFEPFFSTKSTKGTGLGLWISRGIIQKYDGNIQFRTLRSPKGNVTCFVVFIPEAHVTDSRKSKSFVEVNAAS